MSENRVNEIFDNETMYTVSFFCSTIYDFEIELSFKLVLSSKKKTHPDLSHIFILQGTFLQKNIHFYRKQ